MLSSDLKNEAAAAFRAGRADKARVLLEQHCRDAGEPADWLALGRLNQQLGDLPRARSALEIAARSADPQFAAQRALAQVLSDSGDSTAACALLKTCIASASAHHELWTDLGIAQERSALHSAALGSYGHAIEIAPAALRARINRARLLRAQSQHEAALADYDVLLASAPDQSPWWYEHGECLRQCRRYVDAVTSCERAIALDAHAVAAIMCKGVALASLGAIESAQQTFNQAFLCDSERAARYGHQENPLPAVPDARSVYLAAAFARLHDADWSAYGELVTATLGFFATPGRAPNDLSGAFPALYLPLPNALRSAAHIAISNALKHDSCVAQFEHEHHPQRSHIRVAYLSSKFKDHPSMVLTGGLFAAHDRSRFEVFGYALNHDDGSHVRRNAATEFDHFVDLSMLNDAAAVRRIRDDGIDILVDLNGYSDEARPGILSQRAAPLQLSYGGHSHSLFAPWIDYRITDRVCEPDDWGQPLCEARAFLPASFYPYDTARCTPSSTPSRAALDLPESAFVLCCFTRVEKIEPRLFERWLDLLSTLPDAVLWLGPAAPAARTALRARAAARGLYAQRLIFVERVDHASHLARHRAADLFLDTWTFNAHTTGLDALQAGLPMVSLKGTSWSSRYGASLLTAVGLEELITTTPASYCALVTALAHDRQRLMVYRTRLDQLMQHANPFAPPRVAAKLGAVYNHAWLRYLSGEAPMDFEIN